MKGEKFGALIHYLWECKMLETTSETVWHFLKKLIGEIPHDSANRLQLTPKYMPQRTEKCSNKNLHINVHHNTIYSRKRQKLKCISNNEWINKMCKSIQWKITQPYLLQHGWPLKMLYKSKRSDIKGYILHDSIYMTYPE